MLDLGWANSWIFTPKQLIHCQDAKHKMKDEDAGHDSRGLEHVVSCDLCEIVYRYDSGD